MKIDADLRVITATQSNVAKALGITQPRVKQLMDEGVAVKGPTGHVLVVETLKNFYKNRYGAAYTPNAQNQNGENVVEKLDLTTEKAKHERTKRELAELKLAIAERNAYSARTVELVLTEMLVNLRTQLLGLPSKLAPQCEGLSKEEIYTLLTREIEEKLGELSEYTPEMFGDDNLGGDDDEDS